MAALFHLSTDTAPAGASRRNHLDGFHGRRVFDGLLFVVSRALIASMVCGGVRDGRRWCGHRIQQRTGAAKTARLRQVALDRIDRIRGMRDCAGTRVHSVPRSLGGPAERDGGREPHDLLHAQLTSPTAGRPSWVLRFLSVRPLIFVGAFSYSLYLTHAPVVAAADWIARSGHLSHGDRMLFLLLPGTIASLVVAYVFFLLFERPFLHDGHARAGTITLESRRYDMIEASSAPRRGGQSAGFFVEPGPEDWRNWGDHARANNDPATPGAADR